jgi:2-polyprenyl-6-methoxyphenol hydroxylase-like FAD-dependent oxidoreductase
MSAKPLHILIIGAGPSGLLLALLLKQSGLSVTVLESEPGLSSSPRAAHYAPPAVAYLRKASLDEEIRRIGFEPDAMAWRKEDGSYIAGLSLGFIADDPNRLVCLPVDMLLEVLYQRCTKEGIDIKWRHRIADVGQSGDPDGEGHAWVDVDTETNSGDLAERKRFEADFVVGCDGGNSIVRKSLFGRDFPGKTWDVQLVATNVSNLSSFPSSPFILPPSKLIPNPNSTGMKKKRSNSMRLPHKTQTPTRSPHMVTQT